jgi:hypothetical protein
LANRSCINKDLIGAPFSLMTISNEGFSPADTNLVS